MFKRRAIAVLAAFAFMFGVLTTSANAGFGFGISGTGALIDTAGSETLKSSGVKTLHSEKEAAFIPEVYIQYDIMETGWTLGTSYVPVSAELGAEEKKRNHMTSAANAYTLVTQKASAELKDHWRAYIETPGIFGGFYAGLAYSRVTLETNESLGTGATYGNKDIDGVTYELGFKHQLESGVLLKIAGNLTDYDNMTLKSAASTDGTSAQHTIEADPEVYGVKFSIGYQF